MSIDLTAAAVDLDVTLHLAAQPAEGSVRVHGVAEHRGMTHTFTGWLELLGVLERIASDSFTTTRVGRP